MHHDEDDISPRTNAETFESLVDKFLSRRDVMMGSAAAAGAAAMSGSFLVGEGSAAAQSVQALGYASIGETTEDRITLAANHRADVVIRWGDPLFPGMAAFDVNRQTPAEQARRFGFNNDMIATFPVPFGAPADVVGRYSWPSMIMCVNHEYTSGPTMFPDYPDTLNLRPSEPMRAPTRDQVDIEIEAHGVSVVGIELINGVWTYNQSSPFNRRITGSTPMTITGPAAGDTLLRTPADPTGTRVLGTLNNCAGGVTPWGTYLTAEENFDQYFVDSAGVSDATIRTAHQVYPFVNAASLRNPNGLAKSSNNFFARWWWIYHSRFDLATADGVNEMFRFGWIVEIDPYDASSTPRKRTALGRFKHECATCILTANNRVAVYSGDDQRFDYVYKFITSGTYNPNDRAANFNLLDSGTLYVARFNDNGTGEWLPVTFEAVNARAPGQFRNQADVLIRCRQACDVLGATPMDRPEDVEAPHAGDFRGSGRVFIACTNSSTRGLTPAANEARGRTNVGALNAANPRVNNAAGHIVEIQETNLDHGATTFRWGIFLLAGDPALTTAPATGSADRRTSLADGRQTITGARFGSPDNMSFDTRGNIWIATDGNDSSFSTSNDVVVTTSTATAIPREMKRFMVSPPRAEICGPLVMPDNRTFLVSIQHPGERGLIAGPYLPSHVSTPDVNGRASNWPDGGNNGPRPAVVAIRHTNGGMVGDA